MYGCIKSMASVDRKFEAYEKLSAKRREDFQYGKAISSQSLAYMNQTMLFITNYQLGCTATTFSKIFNCSTHAVLQQLTDPWDFT
jgi:hypothetical protein